MAQLRLLAGPVRAPVGDAEALADGHDPPLEVHVEPAPTLIARCGGFDATHPALLELRRRVRERLATAIGLSADVTLLPPRTLPRSEGKAVRVVEKR